MPFPLVTLGELLATPSPSAGLCAWVSFEPPLHLPWGVGTGWAFLRASFVFEAGPVESPWAGFVPRQSVFSAR